MTKINKSLLCVPLALCAMFGANADYVAIHTPESFQVMSVSPNGKWACGVYVDAMMDTYAFRWNLEGGSVEMLSAEPSLAWDVANDGTVSGEFRDALATDNGVPVTMPGFWRDGVWHHLELPEGAGIDGIGAGISPDGQFMVGSIPVNGHYTPYIWKNGEIYRSLDTGKDAVAYALTPDGNGAAGFSTRYNRTACYWGTDGEVTYFIDSPEYSQGPWNYARNFSPDGSKLLYWGGWAFDDSNVQYLYSVYDIATNERKWIPVPSQESDLEFFDISNNGLLVGSNQQRGYVWSGTEGMPIDDYLAMRGVDLKGFDDFYSGEDYYVGTLPISVIPALSEDENVFVMRYYNSRGQLSSMAIKIDQDFSTVAPAEVKASQLPGLSTVSLSWRRPVGASSIRGYNIYRDGVKVNGFLPVNALYFYDRNLDPGTYEYQVSAVNVNGSETKCDALTVQVKAAQTLVESPLTVFSRQKGINRGYLQWLPPMSNRVHKRYYTPDADMLNSFAVYEPIEVEMGIRYDKAEMANYAGYTISEVSFIPEAQHDGWAVNIYTYDAAGQLVRLASQPITQDLNFRAMNTVKLAPAVAVPDGDLVVAISVMGDAEVAATIGAENGHVTAGYSDLLRQTSEPDFYSAFDRSAASGMSISCLSWSIDLGLEAPGYSEADNLVDHYNIYIDGAKVAETDELSFTAEDLADGQYDMAVEAVYANGAISPLASSRLKIAASYPKIEEVTVDTGEEGNTVVKASWTAPVDLDVTDISYTTAEKNDNGVKGTEENGYAFMAAAEYPASMMKGYDGYRLRSFRFYPLADAIFTFMLFEDERMVCELEVEDFEIGKWNEIMVDDEVEINANCNYQLILDCFDPEPDVKLLGIDKAVPRAYVSELYSINNGESWNSLSIETGVQGNWMIGFTIADTQQCDVEVDGYDVYVDQKKANETIVTDTNFNYDFGKSDKFEHKMRVDIYYPARQEAVEGNTTYFYLKTGGINDALVANVKLSRGVNCLIAEGDGVTAMDVVAANGAVVASARGNKVDISHLAQGIYIVRITANGTVVNTKVNIVK